MRVSVSASATHVPPPPPVSVGSGPLVPSRPALGCGRASGQSSMHTIGAPHSAASAHRDPRACRAQGKDKPTRATARCVRRTQDVCAPSVLRPCPMRASVLTVPLERDPAAACRKQSAQRQERESVAEAGKKVEGDSTWHGDTRTQPNTRKPTQQARKRGETSQQQERERSHAQSENRKRRILCRAVKIELF
jgi:hypothetical protein